MKIRAKIASVVSDGADLTIVAHGAEVTAGEFAQAQEIRFTIRDLAPTRRALHVGRSLTVTIEPERHDA